MEAECFLGDPERPALQHALADAERRSKLLVVRLFPEPAERAISVPMPQRACTSVAYITLRSPHTPASFFTSSSIGESRAGSGVAREAGIRKIRDRH